MNRMKQPSLIVLLVVTAGLFGFLIGSETKQKWVSKIKSRYDQRRQLAEERSIIRKGGVILDDIELEAYHN